ncbi:hypothetical protein AMELA_G00201120 [Ameiurus melas]|uniref:Sushi domain-containing protein n=1 Tax=Ameiurus melas TaxID=219545 RepID=A0A7J6A9I7_AMEME|nr:hypothetical protein AMELA_G00201120 [Ameiurus melas]
MLRYMIICSTLLMTAVTVRAQSSRSITCTGTQWSDLELQCKKKPCGNPGEITNGKYIYQPTDGNLFGATITAECNEGYLLVGPRMRNCRDDGWDGRAPLCEAVKCPKPPAITDGTFEPEYDSYDYNDGVTYSCNRGLDLIGLSVLTCSADGTFQPSPPRCLLVSCERPEIPNAVRIEGKSPPYKYNNFVRYRCNKGYRMSGSDYLTCKEDGWNPPPPQCNDVFCDRPQIEHGDVNSTEKSFVYKSSVRVHCNQGYKMEGSDYLTCEDNGWNPPPPQCHLNVFCDRPQIEHGDVNSTEKYFLYKSSVRVHCNKGYKMEGSDYLTCEDNGWNPPPPHCHLNVFCDRPQIEHGDVNSTEKYFVYKSSVRVHCNQGYKMEGSDYLTCGKNGWNPPPPHCHLSKFNQCFE